MSKAYATTAVATLGGILMIGCASESAGQTLDDSMASANAPIQGGSVDSANPAVGLLWGTSSDGRGNGGTFLCTGTLISPTVVLTAGHCTVTSETDTSTGRAIIMHNTITGFYLGTGTARTTAAWDEIPTSPNFKHYVVSAFQAMPGYSVDSASCPSAIADIGVVHLATPVAGVAPVLFATSAVQLPAVGATCVATGFGTHGRTARTATVGQKRTATESVTGRVSTAIEVTSGTGLTDQGDSGGPLLCGNLLVGTTSCGSQANNYTAYARIDTSAAAAFISGKLAAWH